MVIMQQLKGSVKAVAWIANYAMLVANVQPVKTDILSSIDNAYNV